MNLTLQPDGFYGLGPFPDGRDTYVSPAGNDTFDGSAPDKAVKTLKRGMALCRPGKPDRLLLQGGGRWQEQLWVNRSGASADAPLVIATYGPAGAYAGRAVIEAPPGATAMQWIGAAGYLLVSDIEFVCVPGKPGLRTHGILPPQMDDKSPQFDKNYKMQASDVKAEVLYQNVLVHGAGVGVDASAIRVTLHRSIVRDCYEPVAGRSQGIYVTKGGLTLYETVVDYCGWRDGTSVPVQHADENHCVYVDEDCPLPANVAGSFVGRGCSHGLQMRTGGTVKQSVLWRCPIMGFSQGAVGLLEDVYFEQLDAVVMGHGNASGPGDLVRGFGWDGESTYFEATRVAFNEGGSTRGDSRALNLAPAKPGRSPPRQGASVVSQGVRVSSWPRGVVRTAPAGDVSVNESEVDGPNPRWQPFTVEPYVSRIRNLDRGGNWSLMAQLALQGYASLEQVSPGGKVKAVNGTAARVLRETADALEKVVA